MVKQRGKKAGTKPSKLNDNKTAEEGKKPDTKPKRGLSTDQELEHQITALKAISEVEVEHLLTGLRLVRSYFSEEQLQIPVTQFVKEKLPNVSLSKNSEDEHFHLQWKDDDGNQSIYDTDGRDIHASLLHRMSLGFPSCSSARQSIGGFQFSAKAVKSSFGGGDDLQFGNFLSQESLNTMMLGMPDGLKTPGVDSQRLSIGMTPKTLRLPKHGEMLLSVHGSPLGVYKEDNMEAIHESDEG